MQRHSCLTVVAALALACASASAQEGALEVKVMLHLGRFAWEAEPHAPTATTAPGYHGLPPIFSFHRDHCENLCGSTDPTTPIPPPSPPWTGPDGPRPEGTESVSRGAQPGVDEVAVVDRLKLWNPDGSFTEVDTPGLQDWILDPAGITLRLRDPARSHGVVVDGNEYLSLELPVGSVPNAVTFSESKTGRAYVGKPTGSDGLGTSRFSDERGGAGFVVEALHPHLCAPDRYPGGQFFQRAVSTPHPTSAQLEDLAHGFLAATFPSASGKGASGAAHCAIPIPPPECTSTLEQLTLNGHQKLRLRSHSHQATSGLVTMNDSLVWADGRITDAGRPESRFKVPLLLIRPQAIGIPASNAAVTIDADGTLADLATGNVHYELPIFSSAGAGFPLRFGLSYNSLLGSYDTAVTKYVEWTTFWEDQDAARDFSPHSEERHNDKEYRRSYLDRQPLGPGWSHTFNMFLRPRFRRERPTADPAIRPIEWGDLELHTPDGNIIALEGHTIETESGGAPRYRHVFTAIDKGARSSFMGDPLALQSLYVEYFDGGGSSCAPYASPPYDSGRFEPTAGYEVGIGAWPDYSAVPPCSVPRIPLTAPQYQLPFAVLYLADGTRYVFGCDGQLRGINVPTYNAATGPLDFSPAPITLSDDTLYSGSGRPRTTYHGYPPWHARGEPGWTDPDNPALDLWIERDQAVPGACDVGGLSEPSADIVYDSTGRALCLVYDNAHLSVGAATATRRLVAAYYGEHIPYDSRVSFHYAARVIDGVELQFLESITHTTNYLATPVQPQTWSFNYDGATGMMSSKTLPDGHSIDIRYFKGWDSRSDPAEHHGYSNALWFRSTVDTTEQTRGQPSPLPSAGISRTDDCFDVHIQGDYARVTPDASLSAEFGAERDFLAVSFVGPRNETTKFLIEKEYARARRIEHLGVEVPMPSGWHNLSYEESFHYHERSQVLILAFDAHRGATEFLYYPTNIGAVLTGIPWSQAQVLGAVVRYGAPGYFRSPGPLSSPTWPLDLADEIYGQISIIEYDHIPNEGCRPRELTCRGIPAGPCPESVQAFFGLARVTRVSEPVHLTRSGPGTTLAQLMGDLSFEPTWRFGLMNFYGSFGGHLWRVRLSRNAAGITSEFEYDALGEGRIERLIEDGTGRRLLTELRYDPTTGLPSQIKHPQWDDWNRAGSYTYNLLGQPLTVREPPHNSLVTYVYGPGHLPELIEGEANEPGGTPPRVDYVYDSALRPLSRSSGRGDGGTFNVLRYDFLSRPLEVLHPGGRSERFGYDAAGNVLELAVASGTHPDAPFESHEVRAVDVLGRVIAERSTGIDVPLFDDPAAPTEKRYVLTRYAYDPIGNPEAIYWAESNSPDARAITPYYAEVLYGYDAMYRRVFEVMPARDSATYPPEPRQWTEYRYSLDGLSMEEIQGVGGIGSDVSGRSVSAGPFAMLGVGKRVLDRGGRVIEEREHRGTVPLSYQRTPVFGLDGTSILAQILPGSLDTLAPPVRYQYDGSGNLTRSEESASGVTLRYEYDLANRITGIFQFLEGQWKFVRGYQYDDSDPANVRVTEFEAEPGTPAPGITPAPVETRSAALGGQGLPTEVITRDGEPYRLEHDPLGEITRVTDPAGTRVDRILDPEGNQVQTRTVLHARSGGSRTETITTPLHETGHPLAVVDGRGNKTAYARNTQGLITYVEAPSDAQGLSLGGLAYRYDAFGRTTGITSTASGRTTKIAYDALDRVTRVEMPQLDPSGSPIPGLSAVVEQVYDARGFVSRIVGPVADYDMTYDLHGRLSDYVVTLHDDPNSPPTPLLRGASGPSVPWRYRYMFRYDPANRVEAIVGPLFETADRRAYRQSVGCPRAEGMLFDYESDRGLLKGATYFVATGPGPLDFDAAKLDYRYDDAGRVTNVTTSSCLSIDYLYDAQGRVAQITAANLRRADLIPFSYSCAYSYEERGFVSRVDWAHLARFVDYEYDGVGRLTRERLWRSAATGDELLSVQTYGYDLGGNRDFAEVEYSGLGSRPRYTRVLRHEGDNSVSLEGAGLTAGVRPAQAPMEVGQPTPLDVLKDGVTEALSSSAGAYFFGSPTEVLTASGGQQMTGCLEWSLGGTWDNVSRLDLYLPELAPEGGYGSQGYWYVEYWDVTTMDWKRATLTRAVGGALMDGDVDGDDRHDGTAALSDGGPRMTLLFQSVRTSLLRLAVHGGYLPCVSGGSREWRAGLTEIEVSQDVPAASIPGLPAGIFTFSKGYEYDAERDLSRIVSIRQYAGGSTTQVEELFSYDYQRKLKEYSRYVGPVGPSRSGLLDKRISYATSPTGQRLLRITRAPTAGEEPLQTQVFTYDGPGIDATERAVDVVDSTTNAVLRRKSFFGVGQDGFSGTRDELGVFRWLLGDAVGSVGTELVGPNVAPCWRPGSKTFTMGVSLWMDQGFFPSSVSPPALSSSPTVDRTYFRQAYGEDWWKVAQLLSPGPWAPADSEGVGFAARWHDEDTGLVFMRNRYLDPELGRFTQRDPLLHGGGTNWYEYAAGNPLANRDPLGLAGDRIIEGQEGVLFWQADRTVKDADGTETLVPIQIRLGPQTPGRVALDGALWQTLQAGIPQGREWYENLAATSTIDVSSESAALGSLTRTIANSLFEDYGEGHPYFYFVNKQFCTDPSAWQKQRLDALAAVGENTAMVGRIYVTGFAIAGGVWGQLGEAASTAAQGDYKDALIQAALAGLGGAYGKIRGPAGKLSGEVQGGAAGGIPTRAKPRGKYSFSGGGRYRHPQAYIDEVVTSDHRLAGVNLTYPPQYSGRLKPFGLATLGSRTSIGRSSLVSRSELVDTILHEELHHRIYARAMRGSVRDVNRYVDEVLEHDYIDHVIDRLLRRRGR